MNILPDRAKIQFSYTAYSKKGISSKDLLSFGYKNFNRRFRIQNITENSVIHQDVDVPVNPTVSTNIRYSSHLGYPVRSIDIDNNIKNS